MSPQVLNLRGSLARGVQSRPGALSALAVTGGVMALPTDGPVRFGRNRPSVDVCVGEDDLRVSRQHGLLTHQGGQWWVANTGQTPIRLPNSLMLHKEGDPVPLATGYTPLFLRGSASREHLLELYVADADGGQPPLLHGAVTQPPQRWRLSDQERLVLVVVGQRYLLHEAHPQPLARQRAADQLMELEPAEKWTAKKVEHIVADVRDRLSRGGVFGLRREELDEPVGNALNENLFKELVTSTTLVPPDLELLD
ncbi:FHA domain-containing protein [Actinocrispum wychmicini]|uniref:FHA domain-containing protein n=1 Tax=Actinocrispum wychmicini TaxID=1213861 RepID=A0A4V2S678_9PSEU|nr:FHA domain-containing protein [Actinocrispum wychmicini]TCO54990.1 hypothetical protein EV192_108278 [Actinocrispum wychmicini]